jgi:hypothetical protein
MSTTSPIHRTSVSKLFEDIAQDIWESLGKRHRLKVSWGETSVTDEILYKVAAAIDNYPDIKVELYKSFKEYRFGHDLDLFVEVAANQYIWFALQAKVMSYPSREYKAILDRKLKRDGSVHRDYQWRLLLRGQKAKLWSPFYLFYNGIADKNLSNKRSYGCSVMSVDDFCLHSCDENGEPFVKPEGKGLIVPSFASYHEAPNNIAHPWHHLVLYAEDFHNQAGTRLYTYEESRAKPRYKRLDKGTGATQFLTTKAESLNSDIISPASQQSGNEDMAPGASHRIIISHNEDDLVHARLRKLHLLSSYSRT